MTEIKESKKAVMSEETKQALIWAICIVFVATGIIVGIVNLNQISSDYWQPIVKSCMDRGGTFANSTCYGAK